MQSSFRSRNEKPSRSKLVDDVNSWSPNGIALTTTRHQGSILPDELHPHTACGWLLFSARHAGRSSTLRNGSLILRTFPVALVGKVEVPLQCHPSESDPLTTSLPRQRSPRKASYEKSQKAAIGSKAAS